MKARHLAELRFGPRQAVHFGHPSRTNRTEVLSWRVPFRTMRITVVAAALGLLILTGCGMSQPTSSPSSQVGEPTSTATAAPADLAIPDVPEPGAGQKADYLAALAGVDPGLAENGERALSRGKSTCLDILEKKTSAQVVKNAQQRFTGGNATIDEQQAKQVVAAVKAWCKP